MAEFCYSAVHPESLFTMSSDSLGLVGAGLNVVQAIETKLTVRMQQLVDG